MTDKSNLTPVRVRGKKHRSRPTSKRHTSGVVSQSNPKPRGRPRMKLQDMASGTGNHHAVFRNTSDVSLAISSSENSPLSSLEGLPTELLQAIFLFCSNLNLPLASPHLHHALTSGGIRTQLTITAFGSDSGAQEDYEHRNALLRQKWMTFDFLRACQRRYMIQSATKELLRYAPFMPAATKLEAVATIEENFTDYFSMGDRYVAFINKFHHDSTKKDFKNGNLKKQGEGSFTWTGDHGTMFKAFLLGEGSELNVYAFEGSQPKINEVNRSPCRPHLRGPNLSTKVFKFPDHLKTCEIPEKLLHGPWTQDKGDYLKMLLDGGATIDWVNSTSGEVASKGLEDAIRENNLLAVIALVIGRPYIPFSEKANAEATMRESEYVRELGLEKGCDGRFYKTNQHDPDAPWLIRTGKPWKDIKAVGVIPTTKHMRIAVTEVDKDTGPIISWMSMAYKINIDPDDPEITEWAMRNIAEWNGLGPKPKRMRRRLSDGQLGDEWVITGQFVLDEMDYIHWRLGRTSVFPEINPLYQSGPYMA